MPNSDNEVEPLLPESVPETIFHSQNVSDDDASTATTTISDDEVSQNCESDCVTLGEHGDNLSEEVAGDQLESSSSDGESLPVDGGDEAVLDEAGGLRDDSSDDPKQTACSANSADLGYAIEYQSDEAGNVDYIEIDFYTSIDEKDLVKLLKKLRLNHYTAVSCEGDFILSKCRGLFERDYQCEMIDNTSGRLSRHYPPRIIVPLAKKSHTASIDSVQSMKFNTEQYTERVKKSVSSRLRTRFVAPVMLFDNKFICRSGTLSVRKTSVYETARNFEPPKSLNISASSIQRAARNPSSELKLRDVDVQIIKDLKIQHICDLMVDDRKTFKQVIRFTNSSDQINKDIYCNYSIEQMPYPGCKLFQRYSEENHVAEKLMFDWNRSEVNSEMILSEDPGDIFPNIDCTNFKDWDLVDLTKNYLRMMLYYLAKGHGGLLVHCNSGWDRTPLFISILRLSLWADDLLHESLTYREMAYLTLAYDWYLFGHDLPDKLRKKQEIMHFCFKFLPYIIDDEFSITRIFHQLPPELRRDGAFPEFVPNRREKLHFLSVFVLGSYFEHITEHLE